MEAKIKDLQEAVNSENTEGMRKGIEALQKEVLEMGQAIYSKGGAAGGPPPPGGPDAGAPGADSGKKKDDNVIDAEFN